MLDTIYTRGVHGSVVLASRSRSCGASSRTSPRIRYGVSRRMFDIFGRVFITIMDRMAFWACPHPHRQWQFLKHVTAGRAPLAAWKEPIHLLQRFAVPITLVGQHTACRAKRSVTDRLRKVMVPDHTPDIQIFNTDRIKTAHETGRHLMQVVVSRVGNLRVNFCHGQLGALPSSRALLPSCHDPMCTCEFLRVFRRMFRVCDPLASRQRCQTTHAEVYANTCTSLGQISNRFIQTERDIVPRPTVLGYRHRRWGTLKVSAPANLQFPNLGQCQSSIVSIPLKRTLRILCCLLSSLFFERRILTPFLKEVLERGLQMAQGLLGGYARDLVQPLRVRLLLQLRQCCRRFVIPNRLSVSVSIRAQSQKVIIDVSTRTENFTQFRFLLNSRVTAKTITQFHTSEYSCVTQKYQALAFLPQLKSVGFWREEVS